jgi:RNA polymerase sigma-70 factor (ECF subfamily)
MERQAFERLVREHQEMVFCVAYSHCRDRAAAEDVAQEVFLRAFRAADEMKEPARMRTWLYSVARNGAVDWVRRRRHERPGGVPDRAAEAPPPAEERAGRVLAVLDSLQEDHREIMLLRYVKGLSYAEIARTVGSTVGAVGEKLHRIREAVRRKLRLEVES